MGKALSVRLPGIGIVYKQLINISAEILLQFLKLGKVGNIAIPTECDTSKGSTQVPLGPLGAPCTLAKKFLHPVILI